MLSNYCSNIANKYGTKVGRVKRLIANLGNKSKNVVYYRNLQLYISLGMKLTNTLILIQTKEKMKLIVLKKNFLTLLRTVIFGAAHGLGGAGGGQEQKRPPSLKSVTHILQ